MPFVATYINVSNNVKNILSTIRKSRTLPLCQIQRAQIILRASEGDSNQNIADALKLNRDTVSKWRMRWAENAEFIGNIEKNNPKDLQNAIETFLKDSPRPGCPCDFTEVQIMQIIEIACRNPVDYGCEASHWSLTQLAKTVISLGIVESISPASISRFLKYGGYPAAPGEILVAFNR